MIWDHLSKMISKIAVLVPWKMRKKLIWYQLSSKLHKCFITIVSSYSAKIREKCSKKLARSIIRIPVTMFEKDQCRRKEYVDKHTLFRDFQFCLDSINWVSLRELTDDRNILSTTNPVFPRNYSLEVTIESK